MKTIHFVYSFGVVLAAFVVWIVFAIHQEPANSVHSSGESNPQLKGASENSIVPPELVMSESEKTSVLDAKSFADATGQNREQLKDRKKDVTDNNINVEKVLSDYFSAWRDKDTLKLDKLWLTISRCEQCLQKLVDIIVNKNVEPGMMLELAIKMAALDSDLVMPVFDAIIDPAQNKSFAIILAEKVINNGRPEYVSKIFDIIYQSQQSGYDNFARQLTWVISKLENIEGVMPILDTITGRVNTSPEYAAHVSAVFSKSVHRMPNSEQVAKTLSDYYLNANASEQDKLWSTVSKHPDTLVSLAVNAEANGRSYDVDKYAQAIYDLPELSAVEGLVKLRSNVSYSSDSMLQLLQTRVKDNPTIKVLHKLEDYMRNPDVKIDARIFAAEGLLAVSDNRHARYILDKVVNAGQYESPELQAYIGGRL